MENDVKLNSKRSRFVRRPTAIPSDSETSQNSRRSPSGLQPSLHSNGTPNLPEVSETQSPTRDSSLTPDPEDVGPPRNNLSPGNQSTRQTQTSLQVSSAPKKRGLIMSSDEEFVPASNSSPKAAKRPKLYVASKLAINSKHNRRKASDEGSTAAVEDEEEDEADIDVETVERPQRSPRKHTALSLLMSPRRDEVPPDDELESQVMQTKKKFGPIPKKKGKSKRATPNSSNAVSPQRSDGKHSSQTMSKQVNGHSSSRNGQSTPNAGREPITQLAGQSIALRSPNTVSQKRPNPGTEDVDLRDASVYHTLFGMSKGPSLSKSGSSATRPNISISAHKEKDANRRVELSKLRDDDRARRMMGSTSVSQLHEQHMYITGFEDRLKMRNSPALLGPNILAGAFRNWSR